jgi:uncharacterized membrane protein YfcA
MTTFEVTIISVAGIVSGVVNTMAGGGALLTVPLLVMLGVPGTLANATNRVGVLVQSVVAALRFRAEGVSGFSRALPVIAPLVAGGTIGAYAVARLDDATFERAFGVVMLLLLVPALWPPRQSARAGAGSAVHPALHALTYFVIGLYGGSFQAGVGILMVLALARTGHDLVLANSIKAVAIAVYTAVALAIFVYAGQVVWGPALLLALTSSLGATIGARVAVRGGERVIRPVIALAVVALAGKMLRLY